MHWLRVGTAGLGHSILKSPQPIRWQEDGTDGVPPPAVFNRGANAHIKKPLRELPVIC